MVLSTCDTTAEKSLSYNIVVFPQKCFKLPSYVRRFDLKYFWAKNIT